MDSKRINLYHLIHKKFCVQLRNKTSEGILFDVFYKVFGISRFFSGIHICFDLSLLITPLLFFQLLEIPQSCIYSSLRSTKQSTQYFFSLFLLISLTAGSKYCSIASTKLFLNAYLYLQRKSF